MILDRANRKFTYSYALLRLNFHDVNGSIDIFLVNVVVLLKELVVVVFHEVVVVGELVVVELRSEPGMSFKK